MGEGRNLTTPLTIVSFYLTHQVYRGLKRGHILMALSDQMAWQGELAITQSIKVLQGQPVPENISPPVLILTHNNANSARGSPFAIASGISARLSVSIHLRG